MSNSLQVGKLAPNFLSIGVYKNKLGKIRLSDYRGKKYIILVFYPANFTNISITELIRLNDYVLEFKKFSTQILAVSIDSPFSHLQFLLTKRYKNSLDELNLDFPLISDVTKKITEEYQLLTDDGLACPALFIIDKEGIIQYYTVNNLLCDRSIDEIIRVLNSIQYLKENPRQIYPRV
uniref:2-Cys peroxiredoxin n=1 Tax=Thalassionema bacillare TaxID=426664 RepID=UPI001EDF884C|nr:2-Cys peroxiredoxin [Thalassionema bacillare]UHY40418.1 2-Cys peroxiredoxin [Thalassionema bacillare]UHY40805.1 2-Cys peroxiredoxin [Thalassionema bacillare]UHY41063.1 2-Cys peroxiredoxin [Thalassionema bacillare]